MSPLSPRTRTIDVLDPDQLGFDELGVEEHPRDEPNGAPHARAVRARVAQTPKPPVAAQPPAAAEEPAPPTDSMRASTSPPGEIDPLAGLRLRLRRAAQPDPAPGSADFDHGGRDERLAAGPTPSRRPAAAPRPQRRTPKLEAAHLDEQAERPPEQVAKGEPAVRATRRRGRGEHSRVGPLALAAVISGFGALVVAVTSHHPEPTRPTSPLRAAIKPPAQILGAAHPVTGVATRTPAPRPAHPAVHRAARVARHHRAAVRAVHVAVAPSRVYRAAVAASASGQQTSRRSTSSSSSAGSGSSSGSSGGGSGGGAGQPGGGLSFGH